MKRTAAVIIVGVIVFGAQAQDFTRKPPAWQVALSSSKKTAAKAETCAGCHGANGIPAAGTPFPRLAGLPAEYLAKQLFDYRDGTRESAMMGPLAKGLSDAEIAALARHYAALAVPAATPAANAANTAARGQHLARYGDNALAMPACIDCHGSNAHGGGPLLPPLAQPAPYTDAQLRAFRSGERANDDNHVMREFARRLSDADIKALADYYAAR